MIGKAYEQNDDELTIPVQDFGINAMKPFNLESAKSGVPVVTRDGSRVRIICFDRVDRCRPIIALISRISGEEYLAAYTENGVHYYGEETCADLFMASAKREGWINIYPSSDRRLNLTKEAADKYAGKERTACIKVEWEE